VRVAIQPTWNVSLRHKHTLTKDPARILININHFLDTRTVRRSLKLTPTTQPSKNFSKESRKTPIAKLKNSPESSMKPHLLIQVLNIQYIFPLGYTIQDINQFSKRFYRLYNSALGISRDAPIEEYEVELEDEAGITIF